MTAQAISILGTSSHVGKTWIVAGMCGVLADQGIRVAPFKAQNMSLNAYITDEGFEISYAQALQAWSAGLEPNVLMNPVLLKPETDSRSQLILNGIVQGPYDSRHFRDRRDELFAVIRRAYDELARQYDIIIVEGAGSPVELNLMQTDLSNIRLAEYADASIVLVGDIDRGGIFASLYGTQALLPLEAKQRLKGLIVNKFRGDFTLFGDGVDILQKLTGVPVLGLIPFVDIPFPQEDALGVSGSEKSDAHITICIVRLPFMSNFTDFDPLRMEPEVNLIYQVTPPGTRPDMIIIPGSKNTLSDLAWLRRRGWQDKILIWAQEGTMVAGICGGFQMMGVKVRDPLGIEGSIVASSGLGLFPVETVLTSNKTTRQVQGHALAAAFHGATIRGYEQHMGETRPVAELLSFSPFIALEDHSDGLINQVGNLWGTYIHGIFHNTTFRHAMIHQLGGQGMMTENPFNRVITEWKEVIAEHVDLATLFRLVGS